MQNIVLIDDLITAWRTYLLKRPFLSFSDNLMDQDACTIFQNNVDNFHSAQNILNFVLRYSSSLYGKIKTLTPTPAHRHNRVSQKSRQFFEVSYLQNYDVNFETYLERNNSENYSDIKVTDMAFFNEKLHVKEIIPTKHNYHTE